MSQTKDNLVGVLDTIQQNRKGLADQVMQIETQQLPQMKEQIGRFDSLIAALQVSIADEATLAAVVRQETVGASAPLAPPAGGAEPGPAGVEAGTASDAGQGAGIVSDQPVNSDPAA